MLLAKVGCVAVMIGVAMVNRYVLLSRLRKSPTAATLFRVGILAQPDWRSAEPFRALGRPRLVFGVSAGNLD